MLFSFVQKNALFSRTFNQAMYLFISCVQEIGEHVEKVSGKTLFPFK